MASRISDRRIPEQGIAQLQEAVRSGMEKYRSYRRLNQRQLIAVVLENAYTSFTSLLYAAIYVFVVQGRLSGKMIDLIAASYSWFKGLMLM